jgi:hypothetical protein
MTAFGAFLRDPRTGPLLDSLLADNARVDRKLAAISRDIPIYHTCLCGDVADLDDVRADGVRVYRCRSASCVYRAVIVAPMGGQ